MSLSHLRPWLRTNRWQFIIAAAMCPVLAFVYCAAYWLRFDGELTPQETQTLRTTIVGVVILKTLVFGWMRAYVGWSQYVTFHDFVVLVKASVAGSILLSLADYLLLSTVNVPRSVFLMDWTLTILTLGGLRSFARFLNERELSSLLLYGKTPVFIVGANDSGEALLRSIRRNPQLPYRVVGFVAENRSRESQIAGVPVVGLINETTELARRHGVSEVFITAGELSGKDVRKLVEAGRESGVAVKVIPSYEQFLEGNVDLRPRTVSIEDLLRRDPVQLNFSELHQWIDNRVLLVTGSSGSIGSEICRQLLQFAPRKLVLVDRSENGQFFLERELRRLAPDCQLEVCIADVSDQTRMREILRANQPEIIFHAAAYKHVPLMEANPGEAIKNILLATRCIADLAHEQRVSSFVMISTDKAVRPTSIMGACKRAAELYVQALSLQSDCQFVTVRFGNVLDSAGSVLPVFREQIARGGPITVTHPEMERFFMTIPEASQLVIQAGGMGRGGEIFVLDMGKPVRILDLAKDMVRLSGLATGEDIEIEFVGMRPGEKLYEELHAEGEEHLNTSHPKIHVAKSMPCEFQTMTASLDQFAADPLAGKSEIIAELRKIVPEFVRPEERVDTPLPQRRAA